MSPGEPLRLSLKTYFAMSAASLPTRLVRLRRDHWNANIAAQDTLLSRQADLPVSRKLLYVEPSPAHPEEESNRTGKLNAIETSLAALVTSPGY